MKWLYRILRLFFCPHKYELEDKVETTLKYTNGKSIQKLNYIDRCKFCGKHKAFTL